MTDLLAEFNAGREAHHTGADCPFLATSACADAWHVGRAYEARRPTVYLADKVTAGRGPRINVRDGAGHPNRSRAPRFVYRVAWCGLPDPAVILERERVQS